MKFKFHCSGIKYCEYLSPNLQSICHTEVSEELVTTIQNERQKIREGMANVRRRAAIA
jgi:hypothetical protein